MASVEYSKLTNEQLIDEYQAGAAAIAATVQGIAGDQWHTRVAPGKWSVLEVLCHIADFEVVNAERVRRVLGEEEPTLFNGEPDDFEQALIYDKRNPQEELAVIGAIRAQTARILRSIPAKAWQRRGVHSTDGPITLRQIIERVTSHIPHHVEFINGKLQALAGKK